MKELEGVRRELERVRQGQGRDGGKEVERMRGEQKMLVVMNNALVAENKTLREQLEAAGLGVSHTGAGVASNAQGQAGTGQDGVGGLYGTHSAEGVAVTVAELGWYKEHYARLFQIHEEMKRREERRKGVMEGLLNQRGICGDVFREVSFSFVLFCSVGCSVLPCMRVCMRVCMDVYASCLSSDL